MTKQQYKTLGIFVGGNYNIQNVKLAENKVFLLVGIVNHPPLEITIKTNGSYSYKRGNALTRVKNPT